MAARTVATTDTLEDLRTQFNALSSTDFGDKATLAGGISATTIVGAVNEIFATAAAAGGYIMSDGSNTQTVDSGQTVTFAGTSNEIEVAVSATDTLTIGLPSAVAITTSLTIGGVAVPTISSTSTLTNKTLTSPTITTPTITTPVINAGAQLKNGSTSAGFLEFFEDSDNGTNKVTLIGPASTADVTLTLPSATDTLVGKATTDTLTNKTLTSPALNTATVGTSISHADNVKALFGTGNDLEIYHDGSNSNISDVGTGKLVLRSDGTGVDINKGSSENIAKFIVDGAVELYHDNSKKLETTSTGVEVTGGVRSPSGSDLTIGRTSGALITAGGDAFVPTSTNSFDLGSSSATFRDIYVEKLKTTTNGVQISSGGLGVGTDAGSTDGQIRATDDITAFYSSDIALKENIYNIPSASEKIEQLNGVLFDWKEEFIKNNGGEDGYFIRKTDVGVIAQDVEKVLPEVVGTRPNGVKAVKYDRLVALLIEGFKELKQEIKDLKSYK